MGKKLIVGLSLCAFFTGSVAFAEGSIPADRIAKVENTYNAGGCGTGKYMECYYEVGRASTETLALEAQTAAKACADKGFPSYRIVGSILTYETTVLSLGTDVVGRRKSTAECLTAQEAQAIAGKAAQEQAAEQAEREARAKQRQTQEYNTALKLALADWGNPDCAFRFETAGSQESLLRRLADLGSPFISTTSVREFNRVVQQCSNDASALRRTKRFSPVQRLVLLGFDGDMETRRVVTQAMLRIISGETMPEALNTIVAIQNPESAEAKELSKLGGAEILLNNVNRDEAVMGSAIYNVLAVISSRFSAIPNCAEKATATLAALQAIKIPAGANPMTIQKIESMIPEIQFQLSQYVTADSCK